MNARAYHLSSYLFLVVLMPCSVVPAEEVKTVPLDQVWAYNMPGTRDIRELELDHHPRLSHGKIIGGIRRALSDRPPVNTKARSGFAVVGNGREALLKAHAVLVEGDTPHAMFPEGSEITVVFFSYQLGSYVRLSKIERDGNQINITYDFVAHKSTSATEHLALIPLGMLNRGEYHVELKHLPTASERFGAELQEIDWARRFVCSSFYFKIDEAVTK